MITSGNYHLNCFGSNIRVTVKAMPKKGKYALSFRGDEGVLGKPLLVFSRFLERRGNAKKLAMLLMGYDIFINFDEMASVTEIASVNNG